VEGQKTYWQKKEGLHQKRRGLQNEKFTADNLQRTGARKEGRDNTDGSPGKGRTSSGREPESLQQLNPKGGREKSGFVNYIVLDDAWDQP